MFFIKIILLYNIPVTVLRLASKGHALKALRIHMQIIHSNVEELVQTVYVKIFFYFSYTGSALKLFVLKTECLCPLCDFQHPLPVSNAMNSLVWTTLGQHQVTAH